MNLGQRLNYFIERQMFISVREFEKKCKLPAGSIHRAVSGTNIGADKLEIIAKTFPELNMDWLLTGDGAMLDNNSALSQDENTNHVMEPNVRYSTPLADTLDKLSQALLNFSQSEQKRVDQQTEHIGIVKNLVENNTLLAKNNEKLVDLLKKE